MWGPPCTIMPPSHSSSTSAFLALSSSISVFFALVAHVQLEWRHPHAPCRPITAIRLTSARLHAPSLPTANGRMRGTRPQHNTSHPSLAIAFRASTSFAHPCRISRTLHAHAAVSFPAAMTTSMPIRTTFTTLLEAALSTCRPLIRISTFVSPKRLRPFPRHSNSGVLHGCRGKVSSTMLYSIMYYLSTSCTKVVLSGPVHLGLRVPTASHAMQWVLWSCAESELGISRETRSTTRTLPAETPEIALVFLR